MSWNSLRFYANSRAVNQELASHIVGLRVTFMCEGIFNDILASIVIGALLELQCCIQILMENYAPEALISPLPAH